MIISASRRTDIPAWYFKWFMQRIKENYVLTANPYNPKNVKKIPLSPETVDCIVFWSKNPAPALEHLSSLTDEGYKYYFQFTLTPYGKELESNLPDKKILLNTFCKTAKIAPTIWRYDPILITPELDVSFHIRSFTDIAKTLAGYTNKCTISFVEIYNKLEKVFKRENISAPSADDMSILAKELPQIGKYYGITVSICCPQKDFSAYGLKSSACIDAAVIEKIIGRPVSSNPDKGQRKGCNCISSIDIGAYDTCPSGCIYCYASSSAKKAMNFLKAHDSCLPLLARKLPDGMTVKQPYIQGESLF